jgi:glycosyltransferase involved in cell wall biosynthesis
MILYYTIINKKYRIVHFLNFNQIRYFLKGRKIFEPLIITAGIWNSVESFIPLLRIYLTFIFLKLKYSNINFAILCNTEREFKLLKYLNLIAIEIRFCNQNCFVDENVFVINDSKKEYDSLYNAKLVKWKNHYLAKGIERIALVTYLVENNDLLEKIKKWCPKAIWLNFDKNWKYAFKTASEIANFMNQSYCTLALSKREGAMYSSIESLLCGIPVVSIASKGGRDVFFTDNNSIIVKAYPKDVAKAVYDIKNNKLSFNSKQIRNDVLNKMKVHRKIYFDLVNSLVKKKYSTEFEVRKKWNEVFIDKLRNESTPQKIWDILEN